MALPNDQLFLERFIAFNKRRYAEDPHILSQLDRLTLDNTEFNNFRVVESTPGVYTHIVDVLTPKILMGDDQQYLPADYAKDGVSELKDGTVLLLEEIKERSEQGIYLLVTGGAEYAGAVLVWKGHKTDENIINLIRQNCYFELGEAEVMVSQDKSTVDVNSRTIDSLLFVVEGLYDNLPRFNGQYRANGSVRAL